jgi:hypothetical protein
MKIHLKTSIALLLVIVCTGLAISYPIIGVVIFCSVILALIYTLLYDFIKDSF